MNIWKASIAAALLVLPVSFGAFADTSVTLAPTTQPGYGSFNPSNPGYGGLPPGYQNQMIPGGVQQYYNSIMSPPGGTRPPGQQGTAMNSGNNGQTAPPVQYHYKNPNPNLGGIPEDQLPQRLFHDIPPHYYGIAGEK